jgi:D-aminopeptidase
MLLHVTFFLVFNDTRNTKSTFLALTGACDRKKDRTMSKKRARDLGLNFRGVTGQHNSLVDVPGVLVGQSEIRGKCESTGHQIYTGVTAILPRGTQSEASPVLAGQFSLNGNGEMTGSHWIRDAGQFLGPICLTNTHSVGIAHHASVKWMTRQYAQVFRSEHVWAMPVIAETYDGVLNDIVGQHVTSDHVLEALNTARDDWAAEGNTGGGSGMICYEFKGGTGTCSRKLAVAGKEFILGVLVQANHGVRDWLAICGEPIGELMQNDRLIERETGSIIVIFATDLPMRPDQLQRLARRAGLGIGRAGTPGGNNSGDIFLAFSTANPQPMPGLGSPFASIQHINDDLLDTIYLAAVDATDEAIINAMVAAEDTPTFKPVGRVCRAIDTARLVEILQAAGKIRQSAG